MEGNPLHYSGYVTTPDSDPDVLDITSGLRSARCSLQRTHSIRLPTALAATCLLAIGVSLLSAPHFRELRAGRPRIVNAGTSAAVGLASSPVLQPQWLDVRALGNIYPRGGDGFVYPTAAQRKNAYDVEQAESLMLKPAFQSTDARSVKMIITSQHTSSEATSASASLQASGWGASVQAGLESTQQSTSSTSRVTFYQMNHISATQPTSMLACPALSAYAKKILTSKGEAAFREEFGTHFVSGYKASGMAMVQMYVEEQDQRKKDELAADLSGSYSGFGVSVSASAGFKKSAEEKIGKRKQMTQWVKHGLKGSPESADMAVLGEYITNIETYFDPQANRNTAQLRPHSWCDEYNVIVQQRGTAASQLLLKAYAEENKALFDVWSMIKYNDRSAAEIQSISLDVFEAFKSSGIPEAMGRQRTTLRELLEASNSNGFTATTSSEISHLQEQAQETAWKLQHFSETQKTEALKDFMERCSSDSQCKSGKCASDVYVVGTTHNQQGWPENTVCSALGYHCCVGTQAAEVHCNKPDECTSGCCLASSRAGVLCNSLANANFYANSSEAGWRAYCR